MARPAFIRDEEIVAAARTVFLARGFEATTAEVAAQAGISEGSIFKRYKSKAELFQAAMRPDVEHPPFVRLLAQERTGTLEETLVALALEVAAFFRTVTPLILMSWSHPEGRMLCGGETPVPVQTLRALERFFAAELAAGRLRGCDPEVLARAFLGGIHNHVFFDLLFKGHTPHTTPESFVRGLVHLLLHGALAAPEPTP
jgi:AcrR family transcriptional regulator